MNNSIEIKNNHIENEIYSLLITWLIFEIDKKDGKRKSNIGQDLQLLEHLNRIDVSKQIKATLNQFFKYYDYVNPRIAFELTKVLSLARMKKEGELTVLFQQLLEWVFYGSKTDHSGVGHGIHSALTQDVLESTLKRHLIDNIEYKIIDNILRIRNTYVHGVRDYVTSDQSMDIHTVITLIKIILKLDHQNQPQIFSIGYGNRTKEEFLNCLTKYNIKSLIDVRSKPFSKYNPDFNKSVLETVLTDNGIEYEFFGEYLGGRPEDSSSYLENGKVDYEVVRNKTFFRKGIDLLREKFNKKGRIALMCSELKPEECHRSKLIGEFLTNQVQIPILHINEIGDLKSHKEVMTLVRGGINDNLFDESHLTSRKKYH
jgi:hypothetical protein